MSKGRHHTYGTELRTDTASCNGLTVAAKGQRGEEHGGTCGTERCKEKVRKREKGKVKVGMGMCVQRRGNKRERMRE